MGVLAQSRCRVNHALSVWLHGSCLVCSPQKNLADFLDLYWKRLEMVPKGYLVVVVPVTVLMQAVVMMSKWMPIRHLSSFCTSSFRKICVAMGPNLLIIILVCSITSLYFNVVRKTVIVHSREAQKSPFVSQLARARIGFTLVRSGEPLP